MIYITKKGERTPETLIAVVGVESRAEEMINSLSRSDFLRAYEFQTRSLYHLLKEKIVVPTPMEWIVESDRKHQEREVASRIENLCEPIKN